MMAIEFRTSKTRENLMKAYAGESQARNRYTIAAEKAALEELYAISQVFLFTADQERAHAQRYYELLEPVSGESVRICGDYPVDLQEETLLQLQAAIHNEFAEFEKIYPTFGDIAKQEGMYEAASAFYQIAEIEKIHGERFKKLADMLKNGTYFEVPEECKWMCLNCGHIHIGKKVPGICPVCRHSKGYFIPLGLAPFIASDMG